jgi:hypothetical protein
MKKRRTEDDKEKEILRSCTAGIFGGNDFAASSSVCGNHSRYNAVSLDGSKGFGQCDTCVS